MRGQATHAERSQLTRGSRRDDNQPHVTFSFGRAVASLVLAPCIALSAIVAPAHLHEADDDHTHAAVHRHLQPHSGAAHDDDHAQLADDDGHVVWLDEVALRESGFQIEAPALPPAPRFELVRDLAAWASPPDYDSAPPHGPPRTDLSLRAPPALSA